MKIILSNQEVQDIIAEHLIKAGMPFDDNEINVTEDGAEIDFSVVKEAPKPTKKHRKQKVEPETTDTNTDTELDEETQKVEEANDEKDQDFSIFG
ncbi:hypothetical protein MOMA_06956 [Moraxella macacae 0408225]|uniref:Uncharacterized protein n=1 Tax=Moraxella macacae 0408225 TaxID=1230338 RepID=L2F668_9GAMM|nr:hypothetical protein [Moraxella macacae]ELA08281.1 hypothetical protein MOMA_06956 [Moraxella macacae 0408225]